MVEIRCPGIKSHYRKKGELVIAERHCNSLLYFVDPNIEGSRSARKCSDCKNVIKTTVKDGVVHVSVLGKKAKIKTDTGRVVVDVEKTTT